MKTLIELYDREPIYNYLAATVFRPQKVCFIGGKKALTPEARAAAEKFASLAGLDCRFEFVYADANNFGEMRRTLSEIISKEEKIGNECTLDVTGGRDLALVAAGSLIPEKASIVYYDRTVNSFRFPGSDRLQSVDIGLPAEAFIATAGGTVYSKPRNMDFSGDEWDVIRKVVRVYFENREVWNRFIKYLQQVSKKEGEKVSDNLYVDAPFSFGEGDRIFSCNETVMRELERTGAIRGFRFAPDRSRISFTYMSGEMANLLVNEGVWLELAVYLAAKNSGVFSDVQSSVKFVWDIPANGKTLGSVVAGSTPRNEVDVVLTRGVMPVFISCKTRVPTNDDLNELYAIRQKFGGSLAAAVLATTKYVGSDWPVAERAAEMGISVLDERYFENGTVAQRLEKITRLR